MPARLLLDLSDLKFDFGVMGHMEYVKTYHNFTGIKAQCKTYNMTADLPKVAKSFAPIEA